MIATCTQQNGNGGKAMKNGNHTSQRKGGGGGGASAEPDDSNVESKFNALGQEIQYGNETRDPSNSRLFEAHAQVNNLSGWKSLDADTQASMIDSMVLQLGESRGDQSAFTRRANKDVLTLWNNSRTEAKEALARSTFSTDSPTRSSASQKIQRDVAQIRAKQETQRQRQRQQQRSRPQQRDELDDFFDSL